jgi:hypothetical protein
VEIVVVSGFGGLGGPRNCFEVALDQLARIEVMGCDDPVAGCPVAAFMSSAFLIKK